MLGSRWRVLLDKQKQGRRRRLMLVLLFLLLVAGGLGTWLLWPGTGVEILEPSPAIATEKVKSTDQPANEQANDEITVVETTQPNNLPEQATLLNETQEAIVLNRPSKNQSTSSKEAANNIIKKTGQSNFDQSSESKKVEVSETTAIVSGTKYSIISLPLLEMEAVWDQHSLALPSLKVVEDQAEEEVELSKPPLTFGLFTAVEWNSVGFLDETRRGWKLGANFEYPIGQKLSLGIGFAFNKKDYVAGEGEYKAKEGFWIDDVKPKNTKADCNVFEVPLSLQYYSNGTSESGWWTSVGLHSYFMNRETFEFNYLNPPTDAIMNWEERNSHRHFFGMSQISFGYQKKISNRFVWQIAPYVQLPISRIGHGKVNLSSVGVQTNFKFTTR